MPIDRADHERQPVLVRQHANGRDHCVAEATAERRCDDLRGATAGAGRARAGGQHPVLDHQVDDEHRGEGDDSPRRGSRQRASDRLRSSGTTSAARPRAANVTRACRCAGPPRAPAMRPPSTRDAAAAFEHRVRPRNSAQRGAGRVLPEVSAVEEDRGEQPHEPASRAIRRPADAHRDSRRAA